MLLKDIYKDYNYDIEITGVATDSRFVRPGNLFLPLKGSNFSGYEFILEAIEKGAVAIISTTYLPQVVVPVIIVENERNELKRLLEIFYDKPYNKLKLIGITGTDGKTSVSTLTSYLLSSVSNCANIGTNGIIYNDKYIDTFFTTMPLSENYYLLNEFVKNNIKYASMEVSSEGILNNRINNILYDYCIFTNLSQEHLNTHKNMHNYFLTKLKLFKQMKKGGIMLINKDDHYSKFFDKFNNAYFFSIHTPSDYQAVNIRYFPKYTIFDLVSKEYILENLKINRCEEYNIYNILPAIIIALKEGLDINLLYELLIDIPLIPGRLEKVPVKKPFDVYIDFAHTPNALEQVLLSIRKKTNGRIILVCGAAGEKDKTKRPIMGCVATDEADYVIFTSEDPKNEDPNDIIKDMISHLDISSDNYTIIINRKDALAHAFKIAKQDDIVLVTGKGRESFFKEKDIIIPYSDYEYLQTI